MNALLIVASLMVAIPEYCATNVPLVTAKANLTECLTEFGVGAVIVPEAPDAILESTLSRCDALLVGGGLKEQDLPRRVAFEHRMICLALKRGMPIVGICHGEQAINTYLGGELESVPRKGIRHPRPASQEEDNFHVAEVLKGDSLVSRMFGEGELRINSSHTKCVGKVGKGLRITMRAADGTIEAFEHEKLPIFGFQFHPERLWKIDRKFGELILRGLKGGK